MDHAGVFHIDLDVVQPERGAVLALIDEGELHTPGILELIGNGDLGLGLLPGAELVLLVPVPQLPDLLPVCAVVGGSHDLQVVVVVLHAPVVVGVEVEDDARLGVLRAQVDGGADEPLVLLLRLGEVAHGHLAAVLRALIPGLDGLGLQRPALGREAGLLKVLGEDGLGGNDDLGVIHVALRLEGIDLAVAGVVVDHDLQVLAEARDVVGALGLRPRLGLRHGEAGQLLALGVVGDGNVGDELVIRDREVHEILAVLHADGDVLGLRLFQVDGDGEAPGRLGVVGRMGIIGKLRADGDDDLIVVLQLGVAVLLGAVPGIELAVVRHAGGHDLIVVAVVDGLGLIVHRVVVVDLRGGGVLDLIVQGLRVAQQAGIHKAQGVHVVVVVGGDGVAVGKISHAVMIGVVAQVGVDGVLQGVGGRRIHVGLGPGVLAVQQVAVIPGVHDGSLRPVAVEAHVGEGQHRLHLKLRRQGHKPLRVSTVFKGVQILLVGIGQHHGDFHRHTAAGGDLHGLGTDPAQQIGQFRHLVDILAAQLLRDLLAVRLDVAAHGVGEGRIRQVVDLKLHGVAAASRGIVAQLHLGQSAAHGGEIGVRRGSGGDIHAARALLPGGIGGVTGHHQVGGTHQQAADQGGLAGLALRQVLLLHILLHDGHGAGDEGRGHGRAALGGVAVIHGGGLDVAARGGDVGLQGQFRGHTPGGEVAHLAGGGILHLAGDGGDRQLPLSLCQGDKVLAVRLGDGGAGQVIAIHSHVDHTGLVVVDHDAGGSGRLGRCLLDLVVHAAPGHQSDLARNVQALIVLALAEVRNHHIGALLPRQGAEGGGIVRHAVHGLVLHGVVVGHLPLPHGEVEGVDGLGLLHAGNGQGLAVTGGAGHRAVVRVVGQSVALADAGAEGGAVLVARGDGEHHTGGGNALKDRGDLLIALRCAEAAGGAKAHVDDVRAQGHGVVGGGQDVSPGSAVGAAGAEDLHGQDLGLGGDAHHIGRHPGVAGGDAGDMSAVIPGVAGRHVQVFVGVVKGEGHLRAVIDLGSGDAGLLLLRLQILVGKDVLHVLLGQGRRGGSVPEELVADLQAAVHDGDDHTLALVAGGIGQAAQLRGGGGHIRRKLEDRRGVRSGHAVQGADLRQLSVGNLHGEAVGNGGVAVQDLKLPAAQYLGGDLLLHRLLLAQHLRLVTDLAAAVHGGHLGLGLQGDDGRHHLVRIDGVFRLQGLRPGGTEPLHPRCVGRRILRRCAIRIR